MPAVSYTTSWGTTLAHSTIAVTVVHPGGVATAIARNARLPEGVSKKDIEPSVRRIEKMLKQSPDAAAERIVLGIERREPRVLIGGDCKQAELIQRLFPVRYPTLLKAILSRFSLPASAGSATS